MLPETGEPGTNEAYLLHVDSNSIPNIQDSPCKKGTLKTFDDVNAYLQVGKKKEVRFGIYNKCNELDFITYAQGSYL